MTAISDILTDATRALLLDIAIGGAWDFTRDEPKVRMTRDFETAMRFAVRGAQEADGLRPVAAQK